MSYSEAFNRTRFVHANSHKVSKGQNNYITVINYGVCSITVCIRHELAVFAVLPDTCYSCERYVN